MLRSARSGVFVAAVLAALAASAFVTPSPALLIGAAALAAAAGVPHGALDPLAAREAGLTRTPAALAVFFLGYVGLAAAVIAAWLIAPAFTLAAFLTGSAWHFGGDWFSNRALLRLAAGAGLLSLPAVLHAETVADLYALLSGDPARAIAAFQAGLAPATLAVAALGAGLAARENARGALEFAAACLAALVLHPLIFFALYFALLHSPRHMAGLWRRARDRARFLRAAVTYTAITFAGAGLAAALLWPAGRPDAAVLQVVFIGLAALTAPHMVLIERLERLRPALPPR